MARSLADRLGCIVAKKGKKKKKPLSPEQEQERIKNTHIRDIRRLFTSAGFSRAAAASSKEFNFKGSTSEIDDIFLFENVLVLCEYTTQKTDLSGHLKKKKVIYDQIAAYPEAFIELLDQLVPDFESLRGSYYERHHYKVVVVYCSLFPTKKELQGEVTSVRYLEYGTVRYFMVITSTIKHSARFELLKFLGLDYSDVGKNLISPSVGHSSNYDGSVLPEGHSNFGKGYKVISFYVDPDALLNRCYVLRKDGWEEKGQLYQRMIVRSKIESIRRYLLQQGRVFINNIIVTLPDKTKLLGADNIPLDVSKVLKTTSVKIQLPMGYNSVGLIDGQHRVFSYYEGGAHEDKISKLRTQQNLLVTGIIFPSHVSVLDRAKFEATLFLEINSTQTSARSDLKQVIGLLLRPFSNESIAKQVVNQINEHGPLANEFERYFFDKDKLKTTSVVSYGIRPLVKLHGADTLFAVWNHPNKAALEQELNTDLLNDYVKYCSSEISRFISAVRASLPKDRWTANKKVKGRLLTTTNINGWIMCLRMIVEGGKTYSFEYYKGKLSGLDSFNHTKYRSSQYGRMGVDLHAKYFS